ncbi:FKBP-type peptidyl-prolyl cis-trans isomerase [Hymenobacter sp. BT491]|uniref:FKBP-type peptidyl-prolyl cis-trans isomerase n=1 Tax=Hymenobacter sp. BT491 TaxID=2766779 RepID=UPI001653981A|nr:FKBP-type peptidyl-prolyl cis-trans isomerase [Hymenobacter sp. BT491]MBC6992463.1 FKBP-type peptidyl-prolyl cis-trans isomerase [Hymenobacter sp. BT491]
MVLLAATTATYAQSTPATDTLRTLSGARYVVSQPGNGTPAKAGQQVTVLYTGFLPNGRIFDSSATEGRPLKIRLGRNEVIKGWEELLLLLPPGARARVWIPAALAYGAKGTRNPDNPDEYLIAPNTDLVFDIAVLKVK